MITWGPDEDWASVLTRIQAASSVVVLYVTEPSGGGLRDITAGAYDWTNLSWIGATPLVSVHVLEGVTLNPGVINSTNVTFLIETTDTAITSGSQTVKLTLRDCEIVSQGGPAAPFQPNNFANVSIDMVNAALRTTSGSASIFRFTQNAAPNPIVATHSRFDTQGGAPVFALGSGVRLLVKHDSATRFLTPVSTGVGTLITDAATAMDSRAAREFYDDLAVSGSAGPSLIAFGTGPSVQAAIDRLKQAQTVHLGQFQPSGTSTFGPSGLLIRFATAIAKIGALRHTTVGSLAGAIFLDQTGYYRVSYSVTATGAPSGLAWETHCRLNALGNPAGGTPISQSVAIGIGGLTTSKSFLVLVPSAIPLSIFAQTIRPTLMRLQATGTDLAIEFVRSVNPLPFGP